MRPSPMPAGVSQHPVYQQRQDYIRRAANADDAVRDSIIRHLKSGAVCPPSSSFLARGNLTDDECAQLRSTLLSQILDGRSLRNAFVWLTSGAWQELAKFLYCHPDVHVFFISELIKGMKGSYQSSSAHGVFSQGTYLLPQVAHAMSWQRADEVLI